MKRKPINAFSDHTVSTGCVALSVLCCSGQMSRIPQRQCHHWLHVKPCQPPPAQNARQTVCLSFLEMADCASVSLSALLSVSVHPSESITVAVHQLFHLMPPLTWALSLEGLISRLTKEVRYLPFLSVFEKTAHLPEQN